MVNYNAYLKKNDSQTGFLIHKLMIDKSGRMEFILMDINHIFHRISGLDIQSAIGSNLEWLNKKFSPGNINWLDEAGRIMRSESKTAFQSQIKIDNQVYHVKMELIDSEYLITSLKNAGQLVLSAQNSEKYDLLTGLYNRRAFIGEFQRMDCPSCYPISIIIGDINGLKRANDSLGYQLGDALLTVIAEMIKDNIRDSDIAVRWGGDEFLILMPRTDAAAAENCIKRIQDSLESEYSNKIINITASFGYSVKQSKDEKADILLQEAEERMYRAKLLDHNSLRNAIINTILTTLNERSAETKEHVSRMERYCLEIGNEMNLSAERLTELSIFSVLHDIGKIGVDQYVLEKPGPLTPEEWIEMKKHSEIGYRITQNIPELSKVSNYILHHHERWDGGGYPNGMKAAAIPLCCRILAVADAYDAMTHDRIYRKAMSQCKAISELKKNAGTQFDPEIVNIFVNQLDC